MATKATRVNLSETMQDYTIKMYHDNIRAIEAMKEKIQLEYNEKLDFLKHAQEEFHTIETQMKGMDENIAVINKMINVMKGIDEKDVTVPGKSNRRATLIQWLPYINKVIKLNNRFLLWGEIWHELGLIEELVVEANKTVTGFNNMKAIVYNGLEKHLERKPNKMYVSKYQERYGLPEWVSHSGKLTSAARAKEFITITEPANIVPIVTPNRKKSRAK